MRVQVVSSESACIHVGYVAFSHALKPESGIATYCACNELKLKNAQKKSALKMTVRNKVVLKIMIKIPSKYINYSEQPIGSLRYHLLFHISKHKAHIIIFFQLLNQLNYVFSLLIS